MVAALMLIALLVGALLAPRYGAESRPDFTGHPDWRSRLS
jgi:hypothetical protein